MTKKDYVAIGDALRSVDCGEEPYATETRAAFAEAIARVFQKDNPAFDILRFLNYVNGTKKATV